MIRLKNRVETRVEKLKQSVVEHPWYNKQSLAGEILGFVGLLTAVDQHLSGNPEAVVFGGLSILLLMLSVYDHYLSEIRWRDQT